jgi:molecular chaperone DnaK (HSP70)
VTIDIHNVNNGDDFLETLTRERFEELNADLFRKTIAPLQAVINNAGLQKSEIDDIVLVGGSTRIPKIQQIVRDFFGGKEALMGINPEEAVARGAAVLAAELSPKEDPVSVMMIDYVAPMTVGIETAGGVMTPLVHQNSCTPRERSKMFTTYRDDQEQVTI